MAPDLVHGGHRVRLVPGRTLFDAADELELVVPASCRRSGRCHECIVEVTAGSGALAAPDAEEAFLRPGYRLACRAVVERDDQDVEFAVLRRRLRIFMPPGGPALEVDPAVRVIDGRVRLLAEDGGALDDLGQRGSGCSASPSMSGPRRSSWSSSTSGPARRSRRPPSRIRSSSAAAT